MKPNGKKELIMRLCEGDDAPDGIIVQQITSLKIFLYSPGNLTEDLGTLKNLEEFELVILHGNNLKRKTYSLPESLMKHPVLKKVKISSIFPGRKQQPFDLAKTARILASCPCFESLSLSHLSVGKGQRSLSLLKGLKELRLEYLSFAGNPLKPIASLRRLEKLTIHGHRFIANTSITELPDIFENLPELRKFVFTDNFVHTLPPSVYSLAKLEHLEITGAGIASLDEKIGNLLNLKRFILSDNMLEKLPEEIFGLPRLSALNIARNNFKKKEIAWIRSRLKPRFKSGEKIQFSRKQQGFEQEVKKLCAMNRTAVADKEAYYNQCLAAVREEPYSVGFIDAERMSALDYGLVCDEAVKKNFHVIWLINPEKLCSDDYFEICMVAARGKVGQFYHPIGLGLYFECIRDDLLTDGQYIRVCLETALNSNIGIFHKYLNLRRLSREDYEHIWWVAVLHNPDYFFEIIDPTPELCLHAVKHGARLHTIPEPMRTYEICLLAAQQGNDGYYWDDALKNIPPQFRDKKMRAALPKKEKPKHEDEAY